MSTPLRTALLGLRPGAWSVTDASGFKSLHKESALADNYASHVRGAIIRVWIDRDEVLALLEQHGLIDPPDGGGETW